MKAIFTSGGGALRHTRVRDNGTCAARRGASRITRTVALFAALWACLCAAAAFAPPPCQIAEAAETPGGETRPFGADARGLPEPTALRTQDPNRIGYSLEFYPAFPKESALALLHAKIATELLDLAAAGLPHKTGLPPVHADAASGGPNNPDNSGDRDRRLFSRAVAVRLCSISFRDSIQYNNDAEGVCSAIGTLTMASERLPERFAEALRQRDALDTISLALKLRDDALAGVEACMAPDAFPDPRDRRGQAFSGESKERARNWLSKAELRKLTARFNGTENALRILSLRDKSNRYSDLKGVLETLRAETERDPDNPVLLFLQGEAMLQQRPQAAAVDAFNRCLDIVPDHAPALYERGLAFLSLHLPEQALEDFSRAVAVRRAPNFLLARGSVHMKLRDFPAMCRDYADACALGRCEGYEWSRSKGYCGEETFSTTQP